MGSEINSITNSTPIKVVENKLDSVKADSDAKDIVINFTNKSEACDDSVVEPEFQKQLDASYAAELKRLHEQDKIDAEAEARVNAQREAEAQAYIKDQDEIAERERLSQPVHLSQEDSIDGAIYRLERKVINKIKSFFK